MIGLSASLEARLSEVFASPIFVGSPLFTVLDEILLEFDAARLDAELVNGQNETLLSSALERERDADKRWSTRNDRPGESHWWETATEQPDALTAIRRPLQDCTNRLVMDFSRYDPPLKFSENDKVLKRLYLWIPRQDELAEKECIEGIKKALRVASTRQVADIGVDVQGLLGRLRGVALDNELRTAFATFDEWVRRILLTDLLDTLTEDQCSVIKEYSFLDEFFWITKPPHPYDLTDKLACVKPVFLTGQRNILTLEFERLKRNRPQNRIFEYGIDWIDDYPLNSDILFGAFPADTRMSVAIPDWTMDHSLKPFDARRQLFKLITSEAQKASANKFPNAAHFTTLFSVPVLHGSEPLFTVTMILPNSFTSGHRARLASRIRSLGGLFLMRLEAGHHRWSQALERKLETKRQALSERSQVLQITTQVSEISRTIVNPLSQVIEDSRDHECRLPLNQAKALQSQLDEFLNQAGRKVEQERKRLKPVDLRGVVESAIELTQYLCKCDLKDNAITRSQWTVMCDQETLADVFAEVIFAISTAPGSDCNIAIDIARPHAPDRIQVAFCFNCSCSTATEISTLIQQKLQVLENYMPLLQLIDADFVTTPVLEAGCMTASCAIELPIEKSTWASALTSKAFPNKGGKIGEKNATEDANPRIDSKL
jgi:hypothetical protein